MTTNGVSGTFVIRQCILIWYLAFEVLRLVFGVWPAAGTSGFHEPVQMVQGRCAEPNTQLQTSNNKHQNKTLPISHSQPARLVPSAATL